jgi:rhamnose transport system permease protein
MITGGIDLSVGSMMGLAAVVFGAAWRDGGLPIGAAALVAILLGLAGGALNALLITKLDIPPIIVTLGSFSMFRGVATGITHGAVNYSDFPHSFLMLGQGYIGGAVPVQFPLFLLALAGYFVLLHRSAIGRTLYAIGFSGAGARYADPGPKKIALVYVLSGVVSAIAAIIYVAHLGRRSRTPARATSWQRSRQWCSAGRRCSAAAARSGHAVQAVSISVLQNGLRLAAAVEMTGVLTGAVLIASIALGRARTRAVEPILDEEGPPCAIRNLPFSARSSSGAR